MRNLRAFSLPSTRSGPCISNLGTVLLAHLLSGQQSPVVVVRGVQDVLVELPHGGGAEDAVAVVVVVVVAVAAAAGVPPVRQPAHVEVLVRVVGGPVSRGRGLEVLVVLPEIIIVTNLVGSVDNLCGSPPEIGYLVGRSRSQSGGGGRSCGVWVTKWVM